MICWTWGGASAGATARPSGPIAASPVAGAAAFDRATQRADVGGVHDAVRRERRGCLERLDRAPRAATELAVDVGVVAGLREVVLEHADVLAAHADLERRAVSELRLRGG